MAKVDIESIKPSQKAIDAGQVRPNILKESGGPKEQKSENDGKRREKVKPVISKNDIVSTKKPLSTKIKNAFLSDGADDIKSFIIKDWIIPELKKGLLNILSIMFFDEPINTKYDRMKRGRDREYTSYSSYYYGRSSYSDRDRSSHDRDRRYEGDDKVDYRHIILNGRREAERVVGEMHKCIEEDGQVSIADLFDLIDVSSDFTDNNWGWTRHDEIGIRRVVEGFLINVAPAKYLD